VSEDKKNYVVRFSEGDDQKLQIKECIFISRIIATLTIRLGIHFHDEIALQE
jgi:hypothetical protein